MNYKAGFFLKANESVYAVVRAALPPGFELVTLSRDPVEQVRDLDFLIAGKVTCQMIDAAPRLRLIQTPGVGYEGVDLDAAARRGIPVAITVCGNPVEVAEYTLMAMLAVSRRLIEMDRELRRGRWMAWDRRLQSFNLHGKTLGIVGFGRIGREVAPRAAAFGMRVVYADLMPIPSEYEQVDLDTLLAMCDYVTLHVPLTPTTRRLLSRERMGRMKPGAILVNTSRGEVLDEGALIEALRAGRLAGAALDVFENEPPKPDNPLLSMDNVLLTPHVASGTLDALRVKSRAYAENMRRVLAGEELMDCILQPKEAAV
jgi:phosphoglycerate dehydrogenase-like enzyme